VKREITAHRITIAMLAVSLAYWAAPTLSGAILPMQIMYWFAWFWILCWVVVGIEKKY